MLMVISGNRLERLAETLFARLSANPAAEPAAVFAHSDCIVVPSRNMQGWLKQAFLYGHDEKSIPRVLADCEFPLLNVFVNDWLFRMDNPAADSRDPPAHPFAPESMQWRIYECLLTIERNPDSTFTQIAAFLNAAGNSVEAKSLRCFQLAGRLAAVFDGYCVYRPEMLSRWENGDVTGLPEPLVWEKALWLRLTAGELRQKTYLASFRRMPEMLKGSGIDRRYREIHVFCPSIMPRVYQVFFSIVGEFMPVYMYVMNPSETGWIAEHLPGRKQQLEESIYLEAQDAQDVLFDRTNPLLSGMGRGIHEFMTELLDQTEGGSAAYEQFEAPDGDCLLAAVQQALFSNAAHLSECNHKSDASIQLHICHNPLRELEVLKDHLLRWFTEDRLKPHQIQVLLPDINSYAPYIEAVFAARGKDAPEAIPFVITDRIKSGESLITQGLMHLLNLVDSRFTVSEVMELLQCDGLRNKFGINAVAFGKLGAWLQAAGVRWGRDGQHRKEVTTVDFTAATSWRYGLDRLLKGYLLGSDAAGRYSAPPSPCDLVEGDDALLLGRLTHFVDSLGEVADICRKTRCVDEWCGVLDNVIESFFENTNETYRDVALLRKAVEALRKSAAAAEGFDIPVGIEVIRNFLQSHLQGRASGGEPAADAVVFSALRPGSSTPRSVVCLLGMVDGAFPRRESRPAYDLLRVRRKRCDRTPRLDDRTAFLEALLSARDVFYISYSGFSTDDCAVVPPSVLINELLEFAGKQRCKIIEHKLQAFNPAYFGNDQNLFSYSRNNCDAASRLLNPGSEETAVYLSHPLNLPPGEENETDINRLISYFYNPAGFYYREILKVHLELAEGLPHADSEEFTPDALVQYQVRDRIMEMIAAEKNDEAARDSLRIELTEQALIPLGDWGAQWFDNYWQELELLLAVNIPGAGTLSDVLRYIQSGRERDLVVETNAGAVYGRIAFSGEQSAARAFYFRAVAPQSKGKLKVWLQHLFACAGGVNATHYYIEGKKPEKIDVLRYAPLSQPEALELLGAYVGFYRAGMQHVPLYTPKAAYAFVEKLEDKKQQEAPYELRRSKAIAAARKEWLTAFFPGEDADPYFRKVFGREGPFSNIDLFERNAKKVWQPLFENSEVLKPELETG